ncbi:saccharopine dehydrogenase NADP-binding domain-containing protein [Bradyrhizobium sp. CCBAU 51753]|uniref:saccharopine dehydrogenase NADP-binding domain-containing protein n=1 Tax=Bradyrhizobium sp. CCBAU 51753 TaxID=1325100 RepID=UPI00188C76EB|nr:saccharopine dehydrogenase NADP-binding domain-containing protein [Bradyrhizobium sp. CCBAU 51753]
MSRATTLYLNARTVQSCLSDEEVYEIVSQTLREMNTAHVVRGPKSGFGVDIDGDHLHMGSVAGCVLSSSAAGLKWFVMTGNNRARDLPRALATLVISDAKTGSLEGVLDATQLTCDRTAAMGIAAAFACARRQLRNVAVIGAGHVGRGLVKLLAVTQPVDRIAVWARTESSAQAACEHAAASLPRGLSLFATSDIPSAVRDADVVFTATAAPEAADLVHAEWLKQDAIVCTLGSPGDVDIQLISQAWIVVDDPDGVRMRNSRFREGGAAWGRIAGDLGSLMSGQLRLPECKTRIHLTLAGLGVLDVALGARALANARLKSLGVPLEK